MARSLAPGVCFTPPLLADRLVRPLGQARGLLDPACGEGELLLAAWRVGGVDPRLLHGIEVDPDLADRARERLEREIEGEGGRRAAANIVTGDALDPARPWPGGTVVVANPPWVSFSGREAGSIDADRLDFLRASWPTIRTWPSLHGAFLERIARHVAAAGTRARILLPGSACALDGYKEVRRLVTSLCAIEAPPVDLGESAFPGVVEPAVLVTLAPRPSPGEGSAAPWEARDPAVEGWLEHLATFPPLPAECFRDPGVHTGNAAAALVVREPTPGLPGLREGRDLAPFRLGPPRLQLDTAVTPGPERRFRIGPLARYRAFPLLLRQTADRPVAARHTAPTYFRNSLLACAPPPDLDPAFVLGVLNSEVATRWHRLRFRDARQRSFPQVKVGHLRTLPFPLAARADDPRLHDAIVEVVRRLEAHPGSAADLVTLEGLVEGGFGLPIRYPPRPNPARTEPV